MQKENVIKLDKKNLNMSRNILLKNSKPKKVYLKRLKKSNVSRLIILALILFFLCLTQLYSIIKIKADIITKKIENINREKNIWPQSDNALRKIKKYFIDCEKGVLYSSNAISSEQEKLQFPKISVIIQAYNIEKYIKRALISVQNQSFKDLDIVFAEDCSTDNTLNLIHEFSKQDKRIRLVRNEVNRGLFQSRIRGVYFAKAKYIQLLDGDDLILNNILEKAYITAVKMDVDVVQFLYVQGTNERLKMKNIIMSNDIVYQPRLIDLLNYGRGYLRLTNYFIWDKLITKKSITDAFNYMGDKMLNERIALYDDQFTLFCLLRKAKSLKYLDQIGYYYFQGNSQSIMTNVKKKKLCNEKIRSVLLIAEFIYEVTNNDAHDKGNAYRFFTGNLKPILSLYDKNFNDPELVNRVFNIFLNSPYFDKEKKIQIKKIIKEFRKREKN